MGSVMDKDLKALKKIEEILDDGYIEPALKIVRDWIAEIELIKKRWGKS